MNSEKRQCRRNRFKPAPKCNWGSYLSPDTSSFLSKMLIHQGQLNRMARYTRDFPNLETGGTCFGFFTHSGYLKIEYVLGPGPNSRRTATSFHEDPEYLEKIGRRLRGRYGLQAIVKFHSHHSLGLEKPSPHDEDVMIKDMTEIGLSRLGMIICNTNKTIVEPHGFLFLSAAQRLYDRCGWVVLNGSSPIQKEFDHENGELIVKPETDVADWIAEPRTTLAENIPQRPDLPKMHWSNSQDQLEAFRQVFGKVDELVGGARIIRNDDDSLSIHGEYQDQAVEIVFPLDFPDVEPIVSCSGKPEQEPSPENDKPVRPDNHTPPRAILDILASAGLCSSNSDLRE